MCIHTRTTDRVYFCGWACMPISFRTFVRACLCMCIYICVMHRNIYIKNAQEHIMHHKQMCLVSLGTCLQMWPTKAIIHSRSMPITYIYVCMYYIHICVYVYIHTFIHTHTHTQYVFKSTYIHARTHILQMDIFVSLCTSVPTGTKIGHEPQHINTWAGVAKHYFSKRWEWLWYLICIRCAHTRTYPTCIHAYAFYLPKLLGPRSLCCIYTGVYLLCASTSLLEFWAHLIMCYILAFA
jgi:hypothetical protein